MIKIGEKSFNTRRPADIDAQVIAACGCSATEVQRQMQGDPIAGHVARVLHPFLTGDDVPDVPGLTDLIVKVGVADVAGQVATLYAAVPVAEAEAPLAGE